MSVHLLPSVAYLAEHWSSATNQAGLRPLLAVGASGNVGGLKFLPAGSPSAAINEQIEILDDGNLGTATFKRSLDGGANFLGRRRDADWSAEVVAVADDHLIYASAPVECDTDGDGVPDTVFAVIYGIDHTTLDIVKTTDFTGTDADWTLVKSDITHGDACDINPVLLERDGVLFCLYGAFAANEVLCVRSVDYGANWIAPVTVYSGAVISGSLSGAVLRSGRILATFITDDANDHVFCSSSANGLTWRTPVQVTTAGAVDYATTATIQDANGKTIIFCQRTTATAGIGGRQSTDADPAASTATWAAYSETVWANDANDSAPSAAIAPDGTVYVAFADSTSDKLQFTKLKGTGTYAAAATLLDVADSLAAPRIAFIGGALWCLYRNTTDTSIGLTQTKNWGAYDATNYPASWTNLDGKLQYFANGLWCGMGGSGGEIGDVYDIDSYWEYAAKNMMNLTPSRPARSTADGAAWTATFDLTANRLDPVDTVCLYANGIDHVDVQFNATDAWGAPTLSTTVSFVRETIADANNTAYAGKVVRSTGSWTPKTLAGHYARFGAIAAGNDVYLIRNNDATTIYCDADMSAKSGDLHIISPRAWVTQASTALRWMRVSIDEQDAYNSVFQIGACALGQRTALAAHHTWQIAYTEPSEDQADRGGRIMRTVPGPARRVYELDLNGPTEAEMQEIQGILSLLGSRPLAFIPDSADCFDWILAYPRLTNSWDTGRTTLVLEEAV